MAVLSHITCKACGEDKQVMHRASEYPHTCGECREKEANRKRAIHLQGLAALTVDERLRKIEEWIYDYKPYVDPRTRLIG